MLEEKVFVSFDGGFSAKNRYCRPDKYRMIEKSLGSQHRIARGGGYSYCAASFGSDAVVQDMRHFNRFLRFDPEAWQIEVEAGATLGHILGVTAPRGCYLPVQPGYPEITVGGCIAANVHGKNPHEQGTFLNSVLDITLYHPRCGTVKIDRSADPLLFDLTCGGYGLTGVILSATLQLDPLPGAIAREAKIRVGNLVEGLREVRKLTAGSAHAYTWHDIAPQKSTFGRGFVFRGSYISGSRSIPTSVPPYTPVTAEDRGRLLFSAWGGPMTRILNSAYILLDSSKPDIVEVPLFDSLFPFARKTNVLGPFGYFHLFGKRGLAEYQVLVSDQNAHDFLSEVRQLICKRSAPDLIVIFLASGVSSILLSMKLFKGTRKFLRFEENGVCITLNFARAAEVPLFLEKLDELTVAAGGIPNIIKDSRLPLSTVLKCYPHYEDFRDCLHRYDPQRLFTSELSERLHL